VINIQHGGLCAFKHYRLAVGDGAVQQQRRIGHKRRDLVRRIGVFGIHLIGINRLRVEQRMRDHVLLAASVFDVLFQKLQVEQVNDTQTAAAHLVFIRRTDTT